MPGLSGFETCIAIRQLAGGESIPIMMTTSLDDIISINKAYEAGATDFTTKPINWNIIGFRVRYMIRNSKNYFDLQQSKVALLNSQHEIQKLNSELEQRVIERTSQLHKANEELRETLQTLRNTQTQLIESEKMASLGNLVAGLAHEVNTPIGISITALSHLGEKLKAINELFNHNLLKRSDLEIFLKTSYEAEHLLHVNLERASELIKSFKQVSVDQITETKRNFNLKYYLEEILFSLKPALRKTPLKIAIDCPDQLILNSYPGILFQVITILVMNSITHAYEPDEHGQLTLTANADNDSVTIRYHDDGKGIPENNLKKIFDPFFTTKRNKGGLGLGLHIAYNQITQVLGGSIHCESVIGKGTTFIIKIPTSHG